MATATNSTATWKRLKELAPSNTSIAARVDLMEHRVVEELYHVKSDPDCLTNLIASPEHAKAAVELRKQLLDIMQATKDPLASVFVHRDDAAQRAAFMKEVQGEATARRNQRKRRRSPRTSPISFQTKQKLIHWQGLQRSSGQIQFSIRYKLPASLAKQTLIVTLKSDKNERLERKTFQIEGSGKQLVEFEIPEEHAKRTLRLAAYVGEDYAHALHYLQKTVAQ